MVRIEPEIGSSRIGPAADDYNVQLQSKGVIMILVTDLRKITCCPNCGNSDLDCWFNINTRKHSKYCAKCEEEMFEKELDLCVVDADSESKKSRTTEDKEGFIFEMREEINNLNWFSHDSNTQVLVENIQNIFNRIIDYIEEN